MRIFHSLDIWNLKGKWKETPDIRTPFEDISALSKVERYRFKFTSPPSRGNCPIF
jgi:hypothetical protein